MPPAECYQARWVKCQLCLLWGQTSGVITCLKIFMRNMTCLLIIGAFNLKLHECFLIDNRSYKRFPVFHLHVFDVLITKGGGGGGGVVLLLKANDIICAVYLFFIFQHFMVYHAQRVIILSVKNMFQV